MVHAELRGKLGRDFSLAHDRAEDLLTSTIFQLIEYLPPDVGMLPILRASRRVRWDGDAAVLDTTAPGVDIAPGTQYRIDFWPPLPNCLVDLRVTLRPEAAPPESSHVILIEVKLHSGKSGTAADDEKPDDDDEADTEADEPTVSADQLKRYWQWLTRCDEVRAGAKPLLIYLTAHISAPLRELTDSVRVAKGMEIAWLSWRDVWRVLDAVGRSGAPGTLPAHHAGAILAHRGLKEFTGWNVDLTTVGGFGRFWQSQWFGSSTLEQLLGSAIGPGARRFWRRDD